MNATSSIRTPCFPCYRTGHLRRACRAFAAVAAAVTASATGAATADYATRAVGPWTVAASSDRQGCFLTRTYTGARGTTLQFGLDVDGSNRLTLLNAHWSIAPKEQLTLDFRFSNAAFPRHRAVGIATEGKQGFVTQFGAAFPRTFAASQFLRVTHDDGPIEDLDLRGSGAAMTELRRCVDRYRATRIGGPARDDGADGIPTDPFAGRSSSERRK